MENHLLIKEGKSDTIRGIPKYQKKKKRAIEILGGQCSKCSYSGNMNALQILPVRDTNLDIKYGSAAHQEVIKLKRKANEKYRILCLNCREIENRETAKPLTTPTQVLYKSLIKPFLIEMNPATTMEIVKEVQTSYPYYKARKTIYGMLRELNSNGLLQWSRSPLDKRVKLWFLTGKPLSHNMFHIKRSSL